MRGGGVEVLVCAIVCASSCARMLPGMLQCDPIQWKVIVQ